MSLDSILGVSTIIVAIITAAVTLGAVLVPGQRAVRREIGKLANRLAGLEERMAIEYQEQVELIPIEPIEASRGFLRGIDTTVPRDPH